ncbi:MAG: response regulator transcription factor [Chloroflexi bacterium]|nr:response regulator transcription factor [Chloroflexota bacterium]
MPTHILVVEDEPNLAEAVQYSLERAGYKVSCAHSSAEAILLARQHPPDLAVLDIGLPDGSGLDLCKRLQLNRRLPVIFLTGHDQDTDVILGLERGADDYVTKPFSVGQLVARVGAVLRRVSEGTEPKAAERYEVNEVVMDLIRHEVRVADRLVELPPKQFELLKLLMSRAGEALGRQELIDAIWGVDYFGDTRALDTHIRWLREALEEEPSQPRRILTVRGIGYKFADK